MSRQDTVSMEAMRQKIEALEQSLSNRYREIEAAEEVRQMLEDALEDANATIDDLHRKLEKLDVDVEEADYRREEAEQARRQIQDALYKFKKEVEQRKEADLRDDRLSAAMRRPLDIDKVTANPAIGWFWGIVIGALICFGGLEAAMILGGHGEIISTLLKS